MRMEQGEGCTKEEAGRLRAEKDHPSPPQAPYLSAFCWRIVCVTAEVRARLLLTWVAVSILVNISNSLAGDSEVTAGAHKFQKFFGPLRGNSKKTRESSNRM